MRCNTLTDWGLAKHKKHLHSRAHTQATSNKTDTHRPAHPNDNFKLFSSKSHVIAKMGCPQYWLQYQIAPVGPTLCGYQPCGNHEISLLVTELYAVRPVLKHISYERNEMRLSKPKWSTCRYLTTAKMRNVYRLNRFHTKHLLYPRQDNGGYVKLNFFILFLYFYTFFYTLNILLYFWMYFWIHFLFFLYFYTFLYFEYTFILLNVLLNTFFIISILLYTLNILLYFWIYFWIHFMFPMKKLACKGLNDLY